MAWIVALVVWIAAGARIGRVLARQPTPLRNAMVVAVVCAAVGSTVVIPDVWAIVDELSPGSGLPGTITLLAWLLFAAGSAMGAVAVWPVVSRRWMRQIHVAILGIALILGVAVCMEMTLPALVFMAVALAVVIGTGAFHVAWAPLGRGIALIVVGTAILFVTVVVALVGELSGREYRVHSPTAYAAAALFVSIGAVWVLAEMWVRARRDMRRLRHMHTALIERFPEVIDGVGGAGTTVLRASDSVAQIMDAMYVQAGAGMFATADGPPDSAHGHTRIVAHWVRSPEISDVIDTRWIAPPEGISSRRWVLMIAEEYNRQSREPAAPAV